MLLTAPFVPFHFRGVTAGRRPSAADLEGVSPTLQQYESRQKVLDALFQLVASTCFLTSAQVGESRPCLSFLFRILLSFFVGSLPVHLPWLRRHPSFSQTFFLLLLLAKVNICTGAGRRTVVPSERKKVGGLKPYFTTFSPRPPSPPSASSLLLWGGKERRTDGRRHIFTIFCLRPAIFPSIVQNKKKKELGQEGKNREIYCDRRTRAPFVRESGKSHESDFFFPLSLSKPEVTPTTKELEEKTRPKTLLLPRKETFRLYFSKDFEFPLRRRRRKCMRPGK